MLATTIVFISTQLKFFFFRFINICSVFCKFEKKNYTKERQAVFIITLLF